MIIWGAPWPSIQVNWDIVAPKKSLEQLAIYEHWAIICLLICTQHKVAQLQRLSGAVAETPNAHSTLSWSGPSRQGAPFGQRS